MSIMIASGVLEAILAHAASDPAHEVCGLLLGTPHEILGVTPTLNVAADSGRTFEVNPAALFAAQRAVRRGGPMPVGHYHSHPNGSIRPSARDAAAAVPGQLWLIVAHGRAALYRAVPEGFERCPMINAIAAGCESKPQSPEGRRAPVGEVRVHE